MSFRRLFLAPPSGLPFDHGGISAVGLGLLTSTGQSIFSGQLSENHCFALSKLLIVKPAPARICLILAPWLKIRVEIRASLSCDDSLYKSTKCKSWVRYSIPHNSKRVIYRRSRINFNLQYFHCLFPPDASSMDLYSKIG